MTLSRGQDVAGMRAQGQQLAQAARDAADLSAAIAANASQKRRLHAALAAAAGRSSAPLLEAHLQRLRWGADRHTASVRHRALHHVSVSNTVGVCLQGGREAAGAGGRCRQRQGDHQQTHQRQTMLQDPPAYAAHHVAQQVTTCEKNPGMGPGVAPPRRQQTGLVASPLAHDDMSLAMQAEELEEAAERARERAADQGLSAEDAEARLASARGSLAADQQALRDAQAEAAEASADALQRGAAVARLRAAVAHLEVHGCPSETRTTACLACSIWCLVAAPCL